MGEHRDVEGLGCDPRRRRDRRVRVLQEVERPREAGEHHERADPIVRSPRPGDEARGGEGDEDQGGEGGESGSGLVVAREQEPRQKAGDDDGRRPEGEAKPAHALIIRSDEEAGKPGGHTLVGCGWHESGARARSAARPGTRSGAAGRPYSVQGSSALSGTELASPSSHSERARFAERNEPALEANNR